ncbi:5-deoxy-glucuronate isomerase [Candidatus Spongiisocius sp.]|uniref:5-deoxy-glucuronate isomerase n=1 Tax=Candidatus Spongiisocius sp. TaxID=3101273 RepID=UPI003B59373C
MTSSLVKARRDERVSVAVTPESAGWTYLDFSVVQLGAGARYDRDAARREMALVPIEGAGTVRVGNDHIDLARNGVFDQLPHVLYIPPGRPISVAAGHRFVFTIGGAPAEGGLPLRLFEPAEMRVELRGGGASYRQICHILAAPLPAERLILYEGYAPRGTWSGWAPHCHDGYAGSPYLEEVYYFRLQPAEGFVLHRNWREDSDFDETLVCENGDTALVPQGFHSTVACPGTNMYFLNYLAGEPVGDERAQGPYFHPDHTWIHDDWAAGAMTLPTAGAGPA